MTALTHLPVDGARGEGGRRAGIAAWFVLLLISLTWAAPGSTGNVESSAVSFQKLPLLTVAFGLGFLIRRRGVSWPRAPRLLVAYGVVALVGGVAGSTPLASTLRAGKLLLAVVLIGWIVGCVPVREMLRALVLFAAAISALALAAAVVGISPWPTDRLGGYFPPVHPNALASIAGIGLVTLIAAPRLGRLPIARPVVGAVLAVTLVASGSRTSMIATVTALVVCAVAARRHAAIGVAVVVVGVALLGTAAFHLPVEPLHVFNRADKAPADLTFSNRSLAWDAAAGANPTNAALLVGQGLAAKSVAVRSPFTTVQTIDSTWYSAYLEGGLLGVGALIAAVASGLGAGLRRRRDQLLLSLTAFLVLQSFMESTLNDMSLPFAVLVLLVFTPAADPC